MDVDIWDVFVILGIDFEVVEVIFVETPVVVILEVAMGFKVATETFFETVETGVVDGFAVGFEVVTVTEENGVVDCFTVLLEDSFVWLEDTCGVFPAGISRNIKTGPMT